MKYSLTGVDHRLTMAIQIVWAVMRGFIVRRKMSNFACGDDSWPYLHVTLNVKSGEGTGTQGT